MKLTIDQIPCDLDPSQRIALDYDAQDLADVRSGNKGHALRLRLPGPTTAFSDSPPSLTRASASMPRSTRPF
jgi:hypothetical protein